MVRTQKIPVPGPIQVGAGRDFFFFFPQLWRHQLSPPPHTHCRVTSTSWRSDVEELGGFFGGYGEVQKLWSLTLSEGNQINGKANSFDRSGGKRKCCSFGSDLFASSFVINFVERRRPARLNAAVGPS